VETESRNERDLRRIMIIGSSIGAGVAVAFTQALQPDFSMRFTWYSLIAFAIGAAWFVLFWKLLFSPRPIFQGKVARFAIVGVMLVSGIAGFLYPMKFVPRHNYHDLVIGLAAAVCALTGVAVLLLLCKKFLDNDARKNG